MLCLILATLALSQCNAQAPSATSTDLLKHTFRSYPTVPKPIDPVVTVEQWISRLERVNELKRVLYIDTYISTVYHEGRLADAPFSGESTNVTVDPEDLMSLWDPRLGFVNAKSFEVMATPVENTFGLMFRNGTIWTVVRAILSIPCKFSKSDDCADTQKTCQRAICTGSIESLRYNAAEMALDWATSEAVTILGADASDAGDGWVLDTVTTDKVKQIYPAGEWDSLTVTFALKKQA